MIHYLTREQHTSMWGSRNGHYIMEDLKPGKVRLLEWKLIYYESDDADDVAYWGAFEGAEKDINWFLLHL